MIRQFFIIAFKKCNVNENWVVQIFTFFLGLTCKYKMNELPISIQNGHGKVNAKIKSMIIIQKLKEMINILLEFIEYKIIKTSMNIVKSNKKSFCISYLYFLSNYHQINTYFAQCVSSCQATFTSILNRLFLAVQKNFK